MHSEIKKWGNSAAVRLPGKILAAAGLSTDSPISIKAESGRIIIDQVLASPRDKDVSCLKGIVPTPSKPVSIEDMKAVVKSKGGKL
ncbi:AbrB/MazE/SpoVT family DNA-binding domain-containing protein [Zhongshania marina]|uniref:PbsX family transcriptional regulator n=1 Tax=Zhongshania marina TaxID=2304603 RepID=A0A2S4HF45_9GAMM|nr:PbsX family transcriptional regulator [Marortus luteolus]POP52597.1 PbsX family transcriptional regulator [Marortus luteolus]